MCLSKELHVLIQGQKCLLTKQFLEEINILLRAYLSMEVLTLLQEMRMELLLFMLLAQS